MADMCYNHHSPKKLKKLYEKPEPPYSYLYNNAWQQICHIADYLKDFMSLNSHVTKTVLDNGLTILSHTMNHTPKVSTQLWYHVGSKHELIGQKGLAHLLEHMCFKGTKKLSESDINLITYKLSGSCNAFTSHDYTGYLFDFPVQNWQHSLSILAECMHHCTFKEDLLHSELAAVIQELKMYRDNYQESMVEELLQAIFAPHPYHYPIIGNKTDLYAVTPATLKAFYHNYYTPNNATLVVVGPLKHDTVIQEAQRAFGQLKSHIPTYPSCATFEPGMSSKSVTLLRDVQHPLLSCAFVVPGARQKVDYMLDIISWLMGAGRGSRLYKELVEKRELATDVDMSVYDMFDHAVLLINIQPKSDTAIPAIISSTKDMFSQAITHGFNKHEIDRARAKVKTDFLTLFEHTSKIAYAIGKSYVATGDKDYLQTYLDHTPKDITTQVGTIMANYLRPELMHSSTVLPINQEAKKLWINIQQETDIFDQKMLATKRRSSTIEPAHQARSIKPKHAQEFHAPSAQTLLLDNGLEILYMHDDRLPKIELVLELKADNLYEQQAGLHNFVAQAMTRGTTQYNAQQFTDFIESRGMSLKVWPGFITLSMLSNNIKDGLHILAQMLTSATFEPQEIKKIRAQILTDIVQYWDEPYQFCNAIICQHVYGKHPYSKQMLGTAATIKKIDCTHLTQYYQKYISPYQARLAIVGDLSRLDLKQILNQTLGDWTGPKVQDLVYPQIKPIESHTIDHAINRDQVVLAYAGLSVERNHPDYDKLLLFDQIFGGGVLGAMNSRLFQIREQSGLFYTIAGSVLAHASKQPGLTLVKTLVSLDRLKEAEKALLNCIKMTPESINQQELLQARESIINTVPNNFETYRSSAATFLYLKRFNLPADYFNKRAQQLQSIKLEEVQHAASKILKPDNMLCVRIGRIK